MKSTNLFLITMMATAALSYSNQYLTANDEKTNTDMPLAKSRGIAVVNNCEISGELVKEADGNVYAVMKATNPTDNDLDANIHFAVTCMPETAKYSRMVMMPSEIKRDKWQIALKGKETREERILVYEKPIASVQAEELKIAVAKTETKIKVQPVQLATPVAQKSEWTMTISPAELPAGIGFGFAGVATPADGKVKLDKGQFVLARTDFTAQPKASEHVAEVVSKAGKQNS